MAADLPAWFTRDARRWEALKRPLPEWFRRSKLGFFIHWGPYSVPAWGEPVAELGEIPPRAWFRHNPYAEWYHNTIRLEDSPARAHHDEVYGGADYDDFLDAWKAESFDADAVVGELAAAGGSYVMLTTKHHDGVCLWDAPGTGDRNTVACGPRRDLVGEWAEATRRAGMRFGAYYSGGLDWHARPTDPIGLRDDWEITERPLDLEYAAYAASHVRDLITRYSPDVLWNDINWPDAGKDFGPDGIGTVFEEYYAAKPDGLVNDRWEVPHADYRTSEYQHLLDRETAEQWEHCRGLGLSFGYNAAEGRGHALSPLEATRHLVDVVWRGGRLLLGVGPMADGRLPQWQSEILRGIGRWMHVAGELLADVEGDGEVEVPGAWTRLGRSGDRRLLFIDADKPVEVLTGRLLTPGWAVLESGCLTLAADRPGPAILTLA